MLFIISGVSISFKNIYIIIKGVRKIEIANKPIQINYN